MFKADYKNTWTTSGVFIDNFEQILHLVLQSCSYYLRLFDDWANFPVTTSEAKRDY